MDVELLTRDPVERKIPGEDLRIIQRDHALENRSSELLYIDETTKSRTISAIVKTLLAIRDLVLPIERGVIPPDSKSHPIRYSRSHALVGVITNEEFQGTDEERFGTRRRKTGHRFADRLLGTWVGMALIALDILLKDDQKAPIYGVVV